MYRSAEQDVVIIKMTSFVGSCVVPTDGKVSCREVQKLFLIKDTKHQQILDFVVLL
jgi:hypothetical protein